MSDQYQAPTVKKTFKILRLISERDQGARISDLSEKLKISKSTVHGIASASRGSEQLSGIRQQSDMSLALLCLNLESRHFHALTLKMQHVRSWKT